VLVYRSLSYVDCWIIEWRPVRSWSVDHHFHGCTSLYYVSNDFFRPVSYCKNARRDRCQEYHNCFPFGELEETTRTSSNYMDEDYPARPVIKQSLPGWGDNCGSESSTLETDVCIWRYAPLVVHATQEEEKNRSTVYWPVKINVNVM